MIPGPPSEVLVDVQHLSKRFATGEVDIRRTGLRAISGELLLHRPRRRPALRRGEFFALDDVSFQLRAGEALGVLGENGAGKTTLLRVLAGLSRPDFGRVSLHGTSGALIELGTSFDPNSTGREALATEAALIGVAGDQREGWMDRLVDFSDLGSFIDAPLRTYSQGMLMRLGYAAAIAAEPSVLLIDEVLSVGDLGFQRKCMQFIHGFLARGGALVLVSHDLFTLRSVCSRCLVLEGGRLLAEGDVDEVVDLYVRRSFAAPSDTDGGPADPPQDVPHGFDGEVPSRAPVVVRGATLSHAHGGPARSQGPARIEVEYECSGDRAGRPADEEPDRPGRVVWGFAISGAGHSLPAVQAQCPLPLAEGLPAGRGRVSCVIDDLPLVGGLYELRVGFFDADSGVVLGQKGWFDSPLQVEVAAEAAHRSTLEKVAGVLGVLDVDWKPGAEQLSGFAQPRPIQPTTAR